MTNPTNRDLEIMLIRMENTINNVVGKMDDFSKKQEKHEIDDKEQFTNLNNKLSGMGRYYTAVGTVAGCIGSAIGFAIEYLVNKKS